MDEPGSDLQFDRAQFEAPARTACAFCARPLAGSYFDINGKLACEQCRYQVEAAWNSGSGVARFLKATLFGVVAAALGAAVWYGVRNMNDEQREYSIIAIGVGYIVGMAVRTGANGRGGWHYQALAMFLTYSSIVSTYVPIIMSSVRGNGSEDAGLTSSGALPFLLFIAVSTVFAYAWPFLAIYHGGLNGALGLVIIAIGLWQAWNMNRKAVLKIAGPFALSRPSPPPSPSDAA